MDTSLIRGELGGIWRLEGASGRHLEASGGIWEASGDIWKASLVEQKARSHFIKKTE